MEWKNFNPREGGDDQDKGQKPKDPSNNPPEIKLPQFSLPKINLPAAPIVIAILFCLWFVTGFYMVRPDEVGVVRRFGRIQRTTQSGLHYHLPSPIEVVDTPKVEEVKKIEIGFRTIDPGPPARYSNKPHESLMLTGDENIVDIDMIVQYRIKNPTDFLFNIRDYEKTIRETSEASLREIIGKSTIDEALTQGKNKIQQEIEILLQNILDSYRSGIKILHIKLQDVHPPKEVIDAFKDVASAKEDKDRLVKEADSYYNDVIPKARGKAAKIIAEAEAYKVERINHAQGDTERFLAILKEYRRAKNITQKRLYLETMEDILPYIKKFIIEEQVTGQGLINILQHDNELKENPSNIIKSNKAGGKDNG